MRHVLLSRAIATTTCRMGQATAPARLIAPAGFTLPSPPRGQRTAVGTVHLAPVTAATDQHLSPATTTQEKPRRRSIRLGQTWTKPAMGGILPPHSCTSTV